MKKIVIILIIFIWNLSCSNSNLPGEIKNYFSILGKAYEESNDALYYETFDKILEYPDSIIARKAMLFYFFEFQRPLYGLLFYIQGEVKRLGFYEDWEVLDRFYERYRERYSCEAVAEDSSLVSVHQAYIQFMAVCNYEKIKPVYLRELSETIREGDYTYAFNSYLLPEHWEEAADTLMKYYWQVKDEDTRIKMNEAIVKMKMKKAKNHYIAVCERDTDKVIDRMFTWLDLDKQLAYEILEYVKNEKLKFILKTYLQY